MAGDWLKMEAATPDKPEVLAIAAKMGWDDPDLAVGKLFRVWRWFDQHSTGGNAKSVTVALLDRIAGVTGFSAAMSSVGWLAISDDGLSLPNFDKHCGKTAKDRAETAKRVAKHKAGKSPSPKDAEGVRLGNNISVTKTVPNALPREEKRREEEKEQKEGGKNPPPVLELVGDENPKPPAKLRPKNPAFDAAITILGDAALVGKKIRDCGADTVQWAVAETLAQGPADPKAYLLKLLTPDPSRVGRVDRGGFKLDAFGRRTAERGVVV